MGGNLPGSVGGDGEPAARLLSDEIYAELRRLARRQRASPHATLDTTGLAHEAYLKLAARDGCYVDRQHFLAVAARAMRQIVIDAARERSRYKRGGERQRVELDEAHAASAAEAADVLAVHVALERLETREPRWARIVECRFFAGYTDAETAEALGVPLRSAQRLWQQARAALAVELGATPPVA